MLQPPVRQALDAVMASVAALAQALADQEPHSGDCHRHHTGFLAAVAGLRAWELVGAAGQAAQVDLILAAVGQNPATLSARVPDDDDKDASISDIHAVELAAALNCTPTRARTLAFEARTLRRDLPLVLAALGEYRVTAYQSRLAVESWRELVRRFDAAGATMGDRVAVRYQARILTRAATQSAAQFRRATRAAVAMLAPPSHAAVLAAARQRRNVSLQPDADGMAYLTAYLDIAQASRLMQVLTHCARTDTTLVGTQPQRMADALVAIVAGSSDVSAAARAQAAEIQVLVSFDAMQRFASAMASGGQPDCALAGQIVGTDHMIEGQALLNVMGDARFRRLVIDPNTGQLLDFGVETYRPPTALRNHVKSRDRQCRAPGCVRPARYADLDHVIAWEAGGHTSATNLATLCRTHHVLKTHGDWRYSMGPDSSTRWLTPRGLVIDRPPSGYAELMVDPDDPPPF